MSTFHMFGMYWIVTGIIVLVCLVWYLIGVLKDQESKRLQRLIDKKNNRLFLEWKTGIEASNQIIPVASDLLLAKGEECYHVENMVTLLEVKSVRYSSHSFGSMPVGGSGIRVGRGFSKSESKDEWRIIATGKLYVTNRQIYFDGDKQDRKIPLDKIATLKADYSAIEVSSDNRQKSMIFQGVNGQIVRQLVQILRDESM